VPRLRTKQDSRFAPDSFSHRTDPYHHSPIIYILSDHSYSYVKLLCVFAKNLTSLWTFLYYDAGVYRFLKTDDCESSFYAIAIGICLLTKTHDQSKRDTNRFSTYTTFSASPSVTSDAESTTLNEIDECLGRLDDRRLATQRFVPTVEKTETLSKLALGAKLERALRWRMEGQDYTPRPRAKTG
jgi:hypothetical protein